MYETDFEEFDGLYEDLEDPFVGGLLRKVPWGNIARTAGKAVLSSIGGALGEEESYFDLEASYEDFEAEHLNGEAAVMEVLAAQAAQADSEEDADAFIGALIPMAASLIPKLAPAAAKAGQAVLPHLVSGAKNLASTLWKSPATRQLLHTVPTIARGTAATIAKQAAAGKPVTPQTAVRALAGQTAKVLQNPKRAAAVVRRSKATAARSRRATAAAFA
jgi:hypothetical protein